MHSQYMHTKVEVRVAHLPGCTRLMTLGLVASPCGSRLAPRSPGGYCKTSRFGQHGIGPSYGGAGTDFFTMLLRVWIDDQTLSRRRLGFGLYILRPKDASRSGLWVCGSQPLQKSCWLLPVWQDEAHGFLACWRGSNRRGIRA